MRWSIAALVAVPVLVLAAGAVILCSVQATMGEQDV